MNPSESNSNYERQLRGSADFADWLSLAALTLAVVVVFVVNNNNNNNEDY